MISSRATDNLLRSRLPPLFLFLFFFFSVLTQQLGYLVPLSARFLPAVLLRIPVLSPPLLVPCFRSPRAIQLAARRSPVSACRAASCSLRAVYLVPRLRPRSATGSPAGPAVTATVSARSTAHMSNFPPPSLKLLAELSVSAVPTCCGLLVATAEKERTGAPPSVCVPAVEKRSSLLRESSLLLPRRKNSCVLCSCSAPGTARL